MTCPTCSPPSLRSARFLSSARNSDREARLADVHWAVEAARTAWPANTPSGLEQLSPEDYNRFGPEMQTLVVSWLKKQAPPFITAAAAPR
jgi:hypothetical protein